jgi:hypothetical protein
MNAFALVLNSMWQAVAIAACMWVVLRLMPRMNAATRHLIWWAVLLFVLLLPLATVFHSTTASGPHLSRPELALP